MLQTSNVIPTVTIATVLAVIGLTYTYYRRKRNSIPKQWTLVGRVKQLIIYPLKSGRRREIQTAKCTIYGISIAEKNVELRDRCFIVYGEGNHEFKTARTYPNLILVETSVSNDGGFVFTAPGQDQLNVKLPNPSGNKITMTLHNKEACDGLDCGNAAAAWLSQYLLGKPSGVRLAYYIANNNRDIMKYFPMYRSGYKKLENESAGLYQDLTSYLLMNQASVEALNASLEEEITAHNFRPNILVEGAQAYAEEEWDWIKIGDAVFRNVKPCTRCILTTVEPESGVRSKNREPLNTLEKTNTLKHPAHIKSQGKQSAVMGIHCGLKNLGEINVGDLVYIG